MNIKDGLKRVGLGESEIKIYLYLLQNGISTPSQIAVGTGIARTNCYHVLRSLKDKFLIEERPNRKRKSYSPRDPNSLLLGLEERKELVEEMTPDLRAMFTGQINKPKITFYEGFNEVKEIYWESCSAEKIRAIGSTKQLSELDPVFFEKYVRRMRKNSVIFDDILSYASRQKGAETIQALEGLYQAKFLPAKYEDVPTDIFMWDDNIALISLTEPIFGTVLTNASLAKTFRIIFEAIKSSL